MFFLNSIVPLARARHGAHRAFSFSTTAPYHLATAEVPSTSQIPHPGFAHVDGEWKSPNSASMEHAGPIEERSAGRTSPRRIRHQYTIPRRIALPPASDPILSYFTNLIMKDGKRHQAARQVAETLNNIHIITRSPPLPILRAAVERASPEVKVVSQKQRNKNILVPRPLNAKQRTGQGLRWIVQISEKRQEFKFEQRLAKEIVAIVNDASDVLKKKEEVHKLALANRANASVRL